MVQNKEMLITFTTFMLFLWQLCCEISRKAKLVEVILLCSVMSTFCLHDNVSKTKTHTRPANVEQTE